MISNSESKIGYVYAIFMIVLLVLVTMFLLCDFRVLGDGTCGHFENYVGVITKKLNEILGLN
jgi:hypothetical protein